MYDTLDPAEGAKRRRRSTGFRLAAAVRPLVARGEAEGTAASPFNIRLSSKGQQAQDIYPIAMPTSEPSYGLAWHDEKICEENLKWCEAWSRPSTGHPRTIKDLKRLKS